MRHRHHAWGSRPSSRATTERTRPERLGRESQPQLPFSRSLNSGLTALNTRWKELESWRTESRERPTGLRRTPACHRQGGSWRARLSEQRRYPCPTHVEKGR
jgi:hypothetical protein